MPPYPPVLSCFLSTYIRKPKQQRMRECRTERGLVVRESGGSNTYFTVNNDNGDRIYVPSPSTCNVHRCDSNPSQYYALSRANRGLKKVLGSAGVTGEDSLDSRTGVCSENEISYGTFHHTKH